MKRLGAITAIGALLLVAAWLGVFFLGKSFQPTSLLVLRVFTAVISSGTLIWLARSAILLEKGWVLHLAAVLQFLLAGIGVMFLPVFALSFWNDYVDFPAYQFGAVWLLPTIAALVFCVTRRVGPTPQSSD